MSVAATRRLFATSFAFAVAASGHPVVRELLLALVDAAPNDRLLGAIGAGPLEDFIADDEDDVIWLERRAAARPKLAQAVGGA